MFPSPFSYTHTHQHISFPFVLVCILHSPLKSLLGWVKPCPNVSENIEMNLSRISLVHDNQETALLHNKICLKEKLLPSEAYATGTHEFPIRRCDYFISFISKSCCLKLQRVGQRTLSQFLIVNTNLTRQNSFFLKN